MTVFDNRSCWNFVYGLHTTRGTHFQKKYLGNWPFKKWHFLRVWPSNLYFYGSFKNCKMNFSQNSSLGSTPSVLLTWPKTLLYNRLKIQLLAINMNITNDSRHFCFFFGPVNNKWFHSDLSVRFLFICPGNFINCKNNISIDNLAKANVQLWRSWN